MRSLFHPQFEYSPHGQIYRRSPLDRWRLKFFPPRRPPLDFKTECLYMADLIAKKAGENRQPVILFLSGGIDSAAIALSLKEIGARFCPLILKYPDGLNDHDIQHAFSLCAWLRIKPQVLEIDPRREWPARGALFANKSQCGSPQLILLMMAAERLKGFLVFGGGDIYFDYCPKRKAWLLEEEEKFCAMPKYFAKRGAMSCPRFFSASPEIVMSQLLDPLTRDFLRQPGNYFDFMTHKSALYKKHFGLPAREKRNGFERLKKEDSYYRKKLSLNPLALNRIIRFEALSAVKKLKSGAALAV